MILDGAGHGLLPQNRLFASNAEYPDPQWETSPKGLAYTLGAPYAVDAQPFQDDAMRGLVGSIAQNKAPLVAAVYSGAHWVCVVGLQTDVPPNAGYTVLGLWINNPWPPVPAASNPTLAPPPPHSDPDKCGPMTAYVDFNYWCSTYFTQAMLDGQPMFITVRGAGVAMAPMFAKPVVARQAITLEDAISQTGRILKRHRIDRIVPRNAHRVERIDQQASDYYVTQAKGQLTAIDAGTGDLMETVSVSGVTILSRGKAKRILSKYPNYELGADLVWMPCKESRSALLPFYRANSPTGSLYIGMDGAVYSQLTPMSGDLRKPQ
jgi:hypothetical protein